MSVVELPVEREESVDEAEGLGHWYCAYGDGAAGSLWRTFCGRLIEGEETGPERVDCVVCVDVAEAICAGRATCPTCGKDAAAHGR